MKRTETQTEKNSAPKEEITAAEQRLIVVDETDRILGYKTRSECHRGEGILHRAFSIFIFNDRQELLLQKRSKQKLLWPDFWSNSCCSHPRRGDTTLSAAARRLQEELGLQADLIHLYTFSYHARFGRIGSERELCAVLIGKANGPVRENRAELSEWKYVNSEFLSAELQNNPDVYTPWLKMEWKCLMDKYLHNIKNL
jgi:isopentenyl-diphosphate Delta-isomerase